MPLINNHLDSLLIYYGAGLVFIFIYFAVFRFAILQFDIKTPGRELDGEAVRMYSKSDYKEKQRANPNQEKAIQFLRGLGGKENIKEVTNCVSRLRLIVKDESIVEDDQFFKAAGAHGVVRNGSGIQIVVGMEVPKVREFFDELL